MTNEQANDIIRKFNVSKLSIDYFREIDDPSKGRWDICGKAIERERGKTWDIGDYRELSHGRTLEEAIERAMASTVAILPISLKD